MGRASAPSRRLLFRRHRRPAAATATAVPGAAARHDRAGGQGWTGTGRRVILCAMYYVLVTLLLGVLIAGLLGAGFALGCRLPELDRPRSDDG